MEQLHTLVSNNAIAISAIILFIAYIFIAWEKIPKVVIALLGGSLTLFLGLLDTEKGENLADYFVSYIDFNVIFLLVSMMIIVHIASKSGMFTWLANEILKKTKGRPKLVLASLAVFTAVTSAFLDNVTTVILVIPITFAACKLLDISPMPFLITEIMCSNIGGTATLIGDPPNIIIGSAANFSFMDFVRELTFVVFVIMAAVITLLIFFMFRKDLKSSPEKMELVSQIDNSKSITDIKLAIRSGAVLLLVILGFISHDVTHIPTFLTAMIGASILLIFEKPAKILVEVEWNTIFFFVGLFIIIGGLEHSGGIALMADWLLKVTQGSQTAASMVILWASGILSGIIDNIPYTATMAPMIAAIEQVMGHSYAYPLWWSLSLGACLGGNMTVIGAAANVIVSESANKAGYPISFMSFLKYGVLVTSISLAISSVYVYFRYLG